MLKFAIIEDLETTNDEFKSFLKRIWPDSEIFQYMTFDSAIEGIGLHDFDLIVSDIELGGGTDRYGGFKIAKALDSQRTPFLVVSGTAQPEMQREIFRALDAWDYLQKPVSEADFATQARRAVAFRLAQQNSGSDWKIEISAGDLVIDTSQREMVKWNGKRVNLSMTQIRLLQLLVATVNETVPYDKFFEQIDSGRNKENLRVHIREIRHAFEDIDLNFKHIKTKYMIGYYWSA